MTLERLAVHSTTPDVALNLADDEERIDDGLLRVFDGSRRLQAQAPTVRQRLEVNAIHSRPDMIMRSVSADITKSRP